MDNIYDILRRYEFNKTESETLQQLIRSATEKGSAAEQELRNLNRAAQLISTVAVDSGLVSMRPLPKREGQLPPVVGIDGSCQQVGGFGGKWYVPISCAIVKALNGSISDLEVEVVANIEEIQQREFEKVGSDVARIMMTVETKAISSWANRAPENSYALLDGPIIDPPTESERDYVTLRSAALRACQNKNVQVIGCVKRSFDRTFLNEARGVLGAKMDSSRSLLELFPSDSHLLVFLLSAIAKTGADSSYLYTKPLPLEDNKVTSLYLEQGIKIVFSYVQRDIGTSLLRVEAIVPLQLTEVEIPEYFNSLLDLCVEITYPGHYVPLPVQMAHEKCNIREGCAEVLFEEIMTRARSSEPLVQIVLSKLR
jgi:hypothetical protein